MYFVTFNSGFFHLENSSINFIFYLNHPFQDDRSYIARAGEPEPLEKKNQAEIIL